MTTVTLSEAQTTLPDLIKQLAAGEQVSITEQGRVVARLVGEPSGASQRPGPGLCKGMLTILEDDEEHLRDFAGYMP
ncbi:MAG: type II toxin-antitoxin system Phd/YefM family antitoxin [Gemmataceae bacterium]